MHKIGLRTLSASAIIATAIPLTALNARSQQTPGVPQVPPQKQLSFTAEIKTHSVQTLADGTTITHDSKKLRARDSQGRSLNVASGTPYQLGNSSEEAFTWSNANDPVDSTQTNWDSRTRKATVLKMPSRDQQRGCWVSSSGGRWNFSPRPAQTRPTPSVGVGTGESLIAGPVISIRPFAPPVRPRPTNEDLGTAVIMGLEAHGTRMTITTPVGEVGNDKPLVHTNEIWVAPGLPIPLRETTTDPRTGTRTSEVVSLDLSEPPVSTFQPPEGYEIHVDEMHEVPCQSQTEP
jgi:hypothetical protein